jgi:hypothetical protein
MPGSGEDRRQIELAQPGRKQRNIIEFFPHWCITTGKTKRVIRQRFGADGVAAWWELLEILARSDDHYFDAREDLDWFDLLTRLHLEEETAIQFLDLLARLGKIDAELWAEKIIWSQKFLDNIRHIYEVSRKRSAPEKPLFLLSESTNLTISPGETSIPPGEMQQSRAEQRKAEKSKVKKQKLHSAVGTLGENGKPADLLRLPFEKTFDCLCYILAEYDRAKGEKAKQTRRKKAESLIQKYTEDHVRDKLFHFLWVARYKPALLGDKPTGYLIESIEKPYPPPAGFDEWREDIIKAKRKKEQSL